MILFVDDEEHFVQHYIDELRLSGYDVVLQTDVDAALSFFEANHERIDLLILDIMMAPGESFQHERTLAGRRTGVFFYERIRRTAPDMPVLVLTNVPNAISKISDKEVKDLLDGDNRCWFFRKMTLLPLELREEVEKAIGAGGGRAGMIYMVDDRAGGYPDELKLSGFNVLSEADVDAALSFFEANHERIDLLILDIMMAPGESFQHERTLAGRRTGVFFYERIRRTAPDMPVLILTVLPREGMVDRFCRERLCWFYHKGDVLPHQLVSEVERIAPQLKAIRRGQ